jgi:hypothetical protein
MKTCLSVAFAFALGVVAAASASVPTRTDPTRADLPYNPARYRKDGTSIRYQSDSQRPVGSFAPFAAEAGAFRVSRVGQGKLETRERLLELFAEVAKAHSYDVAANRAVPLDAKAEAAGTLRVLDQEAFVEALKGGQTFAVTLVEKRRCAACQGEGVLRPRIELGENRDLPRKDWKKCPWSGGAAEADFAVSYSVAW